MLQNQEKNSIEPILELIGERKSGVDCTGLTGSARAYLVYRLYLKAPGPMVIVLPKASDAERFISDLEFFAGKLSWPVVYFPPYHILPFKYLSYHGQTAAARIRALFEMLEYSLSAPPIVVTTSAAMIQRVMPKAVLSESSELLAENEEVETDRLIEKLNAGGYERAMIVEEPGDYSVRGGIIDVFSPLYDNPVRIELYGDLVDSLRFFSPASQRTVKRISEAVITPCRETVLEKSELAGIIGRVRAQAANMEIPVTKVRELVDRIRDEGVFPGVEIMLPLLYSRMDTFMDYAPERSLFVLVEPRDLQKTADDVFGQAQANYVASLQDKSFGVEPASLFLTWEEIEKTLEKERPLSIGPCPSFVPTRKRIRPSESISRRRTTPNCKGN
jgi:transcription-repair coupling factor (superfamily II helicase)